MTREQLIEIARSLGVGEQYYRLPIKRLIWEIQEAQGREPCYLGDERYTCKNNCEWDASCKKLTAAWLR
jgi:hypothetical protein